MTSSEQGTSNIRTLERAPLAYTQLSSLEIALSIDKVSCYYGSNRVVHGANLSIAKKSVTALIGPSGCGKSTLLRCVNRMNDFVESFRLDGHIFLGRDDIYSKNIDVTELRKRVGMVFQKSNPFPKSIYENVAYGPRLHGIKNRRMLDQIVERSLRSVALWDEVSDRLNESAFCLSGGQQQRVCIARAIAVEPEVLLMDEPCSALDPIATSKIEDLIFSLKQNYTIIIVTHSMAQAARISDFTAFLLSGEIVEVEATAKLFQTPTDPRTADYIMGRFG